MSRLAKKPILIPEKTEVTFEGSSATVKGPLGTLSRLFPDGIVFAKEGNTITVRLAKETRETQPLLGTVVAHLKNMIAGVNKAYEKKLIIEGVGFKADVQGAKLNLALGFSHPVVVEIPKELNVASEKGMITISGIDKELVGQFAANVRALKKPEPYKGKGIRYADEVIRRKQGKKAA